MVTPESPQNCADGHQGDRRQAWTTEELPRVRWRIASLLGTGVLVNYFDRIALSVAAPRLEQSFGLTPVEVGVLFSAFFWSYALLQIPLGAVLDRLGVRLVGCWSAFLWSAASLLTGCASGFAGLIVARVLLGLAEAPSFPLSSKATGYWFPRQERALSTALFDAATKVSNVVGVPLVALVVVSFGWRVGFVFVGLLSLAYFLAFVRMYRDPSRHPSVTPQQRARLLAEGAVAENAAAVSSLAMLLHLLRSRKVWGLSIGFAAYGYCFFLFLTWLPGYLVRELHMSLLESAGLTMIPWACASISGLLIGGWLIDFLVARSRNETRVRKAILLGGMCTGATVFGATTTRDPALAITWISLAMSGLAAASAVCWSLPSLIAPRGGVASVGGIMNFANNLMGIAAPIATGYVLSSTHSFSGAFLIAGIVLLIGVASFVLLLGRIEPIPEPSQGV